MPNHLPRPKQPERRGPAADRHLSVRLSPRPRSRQESEPHRWLRSAKHSSPCTVGGARVDNTPIASSGTPKYVRAPMSDAGDVVGRWAADPIGKHEFRWHDQVSWTGWVSDGPRRSFDPIGSAPIAGASKRFKDRRHALRRLIIGVVAVVLGVALSAVTFASASPVVTVLFGGPIIWGGIEAVMASRYLVTKAQPSTVPPTDPPPPVDYAAEVGVLDELVRAGKISTETRDLAQIKLRRKYNLSEP